MTGFTGKEHYDNMYYTLFFLLVLFAVNYFRVFCGINSL